MDQWLEWLCGGAPWCQNQPVISWHSHLKWSFILIIAGWPTTTVAQLEGCGCSHTIGMDGRFPQPPTNHVQPLSCICCCHLNVFANVVDGASHEDLWWPKWPRSWLRVLPSKHVIVIHPMSTAVHWSLGLHTRVCSYLKKILGGGIIIWKSRSWYWPSSFLTLVWLILARTLQGWKGCGLIGCKCGYMHADF